VLSRSGWLTLAGGALVLVAARLFGLPELFIVGLALVLLPVFGVAWVHRPLPSLAAERRVSPGRVHLGQPSRVELEISNGGRRATPVLTLRDPVDGTVGARLALAPLRPGATSHAGYRLPTGRRGLVRIGPLQAELVDPFGLARRSFAVADATRLLVLPGIDPLDGLPPAGGRDQPRPGLASGAGMGPGAEDLATLRPYAVGDDLRRIHWPSTARAGDLLVRQDDVHWQGHLTLVLDGRLAAVEAEPFERAVSATASILHAAARRGDRVRMLADGVDSGLVSARTAADRLLEHLALAERHPGTDLPAMPAAAGGGGGLVVVTGQPSSADLDAVADRRRSFASVVVVAAVGTGLADGDLAPIPPGVQLVVIDETRPFATAWADGLRIGRRR
jgi:uncharacterized protein (DUF58 family)